MTAIIRFATAANGEVITSDKVLVTICRYAQTHCAQSACRLHVSVLTSLNSPGAW
jgi:hypothetical protein